LEVPCLTGPPWPIIIEAFSSVQRPPSRRNRIPTLLAGRGCDPVARGVDGAVLWFIFHGPVRVRYKVGSGKAQITLCYPGLENWNILPTTLEVPVEEGQLWGWGWHFGPWGLGALFRR
jgi:hypothetical protein